ncbi:hypothetical protein [Nisaea nitritireducens]|uniref:hypothetical protein n=1 Tax=Nisaea nitritireducens TaxID=568392 RepID=UPI001868BCAA|nr:hypothetical protein [Nisaea nitritireducens]
MADTMGLVEILATVVLAAGALGTACFGIVDALKIWPRFAIRGLTHIKDRLTFLEGALEYAYGEASEELIRAQYLNGRAKGELGKTLRQGVRIGLTPDTAKVMAAHLGSIDAKALTLIAGKISKSEELTDPERNTLARFETAVDTRIEALLGLAEAHHTAFNRISAAGFALLISVLIGLCGNQYLGSGISTGTSTSIDWSFFFLSLLIGFIAVPIAPVAKDIASSLQAYGKQLKQLR